MSFEDLLGLNSLLILPAPCGDQDGRITDSQLVPCVTFVLFPGNVLGAG